MLEVGPRVGITAPRVLLRLPIPDVAAGATAAVAPAIPVRPGGDAAGAVRRIAGEAGSVHNDRVGDCDVSGHEGDPPGHDAHAAAEAHLAGEIGRYDAPGPLAGEGRAGVEHQAAVASDVDVAVELDLLGELAAGAEVPLPVEVVGAGRRGRLRRGRRGRRRGGRVVVPRQDRVRVRVGPIWRLRPVARAGGGTPEAEGDTEEHQ